MVADDVVHLGQLHLTLDVSQVEEAFVAGGVARVLLDRQHLVELHRQQRGVDHRVLGRAGVDAQAVDDNLSSAGVEVFILQLAQLAAVDGVGKVCAKALDVKVVCAAADLLVRGKADLDGAVLDLRMAHQLLGHGHNLRHAGLVVRAEQGGAVGDHQVLADIFFQVRVFLFAQDDLFFLVEQDIPAVVFDHFGLDVVAGSVLGGVHVGDEADDRFVLLALGGRDGSVDVTLVIHKGVGDADLLHLLHQRRGQDFLVGGGRDGFGCVVGLGAEADIVQQAFVCSHRKVPPFFLNLPLL